jgi:hypothetical protein
LPVLLRLHRLWRASTTEARRLLRVLFVWFCAVSAHPGRRDTYMPAPLIGEFRLSGSGSGCARFGVTAHQDTSWLRPTVHFWTRSKQPWITLPEGDQSFETQPAT